MSSDGIDRNLNPEITFLKIIVPEGPLDRAVKVVSCQDIKGKKIDFIQSVMIDLDIHSRGLRCTGKRLLISSIITEPVQVGDKVTDKVSTVKPVIDQHGEAVIENFECPCVLEVVR